MLCSLLNRDGLGIAFRSVFGFIDRSVSAAMGCFIGCFRVRDDRRRGPRSRAHLVATSSHPKLTEVVVSQNRLSSLFMADGFRDTSSQDRNFAEVRTPDSGKQLKNEAKYLKACGTLAETPIEIRKASTKWFGGSPPHEGDLESSKFHSWLPDASIKKLQLEKPVDQPSTPIKLSETRSIVPASLEQTPSSCISNVEITRSANLYSSDGSGTDTAYTPPAAITNNEYKAKSVRFECDLNPALSQGSSYDGHTHNLRVVETLLCESMERRSPNPTPLKLSDEMQTPGTVFPANMDNVMKGKAQIRSQFVYSVPNPAESDSPWNVPKNDDPNLYQIEEATPVPQDKVKQTSSEELKIEASLSAWLKPVAANPDGNFVNMVNRPRVARTPVDRPIIGTVAAHWNDNEQPQVSPKWWDGNGIPNSTNKYKEDQKVRWHATPFEERLEKALSEESGASERDRKPICGTMIAFDANEEGDSAISQLQPSSHSTSLVSF